jgi:hypothetical protein
MIKSLSQNKRRKRILQYVLDKGFDGVSIRETWYELRETEHDIPLAAIISHLDRLADSYQIIEKRESRAQGYFRRFYDPRYAQNNKNAE